MDTIEDEILRDARAHIKRLEERCLLLQDALTEIVYWDEDGSWRIGFQGDYDVTSIVGHLIELD